ncbi:WD-40 repeat family protein / beige-related [Striga asiatica]|uniref:WD-40 repeat family protein / beige-related n=1 Tax=Striga asiatica TaxID=4170 RepID=A0A5A7Q7C0_STRAF|nr:WD-40 repeat family protein / beige-related [Striga asiatica]
MELEEKGQDHVAERGMEHTRLFLLPVSFRPSLGSMALELIRPRLFVAGTRRGRRRGRCEKVEKRNDLHGGEALGAAVSPLIASLISTLSSGLASVHATPILNILSICSFGPGPAISGSTSSVARPSATAWRAHCTTSVPPFWLFRYCDGNFPVTTSSTTTPRQYTSLFGESCW